MVVGCAILEKTMGVYLLIPYFILNNVSLILSVVGLVFRPSIVFNGIRLAFPAITLIRQTFLSLICTFKYLCIGTQGKIRAVHTLPCVSMLFFIYFIILQLFVNKNRNFFEKTTKPAPMARTLPYNIVFRLFKRLFKDLMILRPSVLPDV